MAHRLEKNNTIHFYILVPTVIHSHINNQENNKLETTYNKYFGGKYTDVSLMLKKKKKKHLNRFNSFVGYCLMKVRKCDAVCSD